MWYLHGMGAWGWLVMPAFWAVVVLSIVGIVRSTAKPSQPGQDSSRRILDERVAQGEIDRENYEERRKILQGNR